MGEVDTGGGGGKKKDGKKRSKKMSTKIDMTPMVDLAFLLITFFMLTTTFNKPQTMEINMPDKTENKDDQMKVSEKRTLTIILAPDDKIYYYQGLKDAEPEVKVTDFSDQGIRKVLISKGQEIKASENKDAVVLIKPLDKSKYKNMVDILDEMHITDTKIYAIVKMAPEEFDLLKHQYPNTTFE